MTPIARYARLPGRVVMVGFGSIGQAVLPLLHRHFELHPEQISILTADPGGAAIAQEYRAGFSVLPLTPGNYVEALAPRLAEGDFLLNLSVDVSSKALLELCWQRGALYLDTCIEPWAGGYTDTSRTASQRSNYGLREQILAFSREHAGGPTAIVTFGANPGLASVFVKQALLNIAAHNDIDAGRPAGSAQWAALARRLGIRTIHIAERDTQVSAQRKRRNEFVNTWSVDGFISEGLQPAELGWGAHERRWPADARRHAFGCGAAIYLDRPGAGTRVRSWTPLEGEYHGFMITHGESISIANYLTLQRDGETVYRPTVHYAYHPCDDAVLSLHELAGRNWRPQDGKRIIRDDIVSGTDELGVLLMGNARGSYWYGSRLSIDAARALTPHNSATSLQVAAGVLAGMVLALHRPRAGVLEPEDLDHEAVMEIARPYLGEMAGVFSDWTPLKGRAPLFGEDMDREDPWQFMNFRVS
ncbi:homospermidine synthase [Noviherbaspirillum sp.]|uniref:homospermidine synthase n=1 Tax=Noviherbaspirillum sp. TaxID=1926288 RepID=UPI002D3B1EAB|nr:saccharopine dehydrogenase C-terminal domain-containing protein [Noviherbaspirillum sp.]HZW20793.1 saccharopine dehydrogenase C-terminal domain-containing protein [Noviherbaspirillum sp.]